MFKRFFKSKKMEMEKSKSMSTSTSTMTHLLAEPQLAPLPSNNNNNHNNDNDNKGIRISPLERTLESLVISYGIQECEKALKRVADRVIKSSSEKQNNNNKRNNKTKKSASVPNLQQGILTTTTTTTTSVGTMNHPTFDIQEDGYYNDDDDANEHEHEFKYKSIDTTSSTALSTVEANNNLSASASSSSTSSSSSSNNSSSIPKESATTSIMPSSSSVIPTSCLASTQKNQKMYKNHNDSNNNEMMITNTTTTISMSSMISQILEGSFDGTFLTDGEGQIQRVNQAAVSMFGYNSAADLVGKNISTVIGGKAGHRHASYFKDHNLQSRLDSIVDKMRDVTAKRADGTEFPVQVGVRIINNNQGGSSNNDNGSNDGRMFVAYCHDLTEHKRAFAELEREKDSKLMLASQVLEGSFDGTFLTDGDGQIQRVNQAAVTMFGYHSASDLVGKNISMVIGGNAGHRHASYFKDRNLQSRLDSIVDKMRDVTAQRADGSEFPVQVGVRIINNQGGSSNNNNGSNDGRIFVAYCHDLTEHKRAFAELEREKDSKLMLASQVLEGSFDGTFLMDGDGLIQRVNQAAVTMFGYNSASDLLGKNISIVIGGNAGHKHASYFKDKNLQARLDKIFEKMRDVTAKRADGSEFPVQVGVRIINNNQGGSNNDGSIDGRMFVAYCHDLTEHKRAFAELEAEKDKIVEAKKLRDSLFDSSFDCILLTDKKGTLLQVNQATLDQFGYKNTSDLVGKNVSMLVGGGFAKKHDGYLKRFHDRGAQSSLLGRLRYVSAKRKDGSEFPCQIGIRSIGSNKEGDENSGLMVAYLRNMTREVERIGLEAEKMAAEKLLLNILPHEVAVRLKEDPTHIADHHTTATMLFADIVGFTAMSSKMTPGALVALLNDIFSRFDQALDRYGLNKIKTIGDCYMVTSIPGNRDPMKSCAAICHFAIDLIDIITEYSENNPERPLNMRIGINAGPVVAGVVGTKRFMYDIWGPAVNLASRMESTGVPGKIQVSKEVLEIIPKEEGFIFKHRGMVDVKGIGEMETYFLEGREESKAQEYWKGIKERLEDGTLHNLYTRRTSV